MAVSADAVTRTRTRPLRSPACGSEAAGEGEFRRGAAAYPSPQPLSRKGRGACVVPGVSRCCQSAADDDGNPLRRTKR